jgi:hypothetical protein
MYSGLGAGGLAVAAVTVLDAKPLEPTKILVGAAGRQGKTEARFIHMVFYFMIR